MSQVVVAEDAPVAAAAADAADHRGMVQFVGEDDQAGQDLVQRRQRRLVGDVARGEQQRRFLAVQVGQFPFEFDMEVSRAGNVARAARARAVGVDGRVHGVGHDRVLALAKIVVRAPDNDLALGSVIAGPGGAREIAAVALEIGEDPIAALVAHLLDGVAESGLVVHRRRPAPHDGRPARPAPCSLFRGLIRTVGLPCPLTGVSSGNLLRETSQFRRERSSRPGQQHGRSPAAENSGRGELIQRKAGRQAVNSSSRPRNICSMAEKSF